jgi:pimeloyl-ACP methyl ester carboxylesterase
MRLRPSVWLFGLETGLLLGCGEDTGVLNAPPDAASTDAASDATPADLPSDLIPAAACPAGKAGSVDGGIVVEPLVFSSCPLITDRGTTPVGGCSYRGGYRIACPGTAEAALAMAECATACLPADWSAPAGEQLSIFLKRYPAKKQPASGQLWLLAGGPGDAGADYDWWVYDLARSVPTLDIYMPDHRGTGRSSFANCWAYGWPLTTATAASCAASIPYLADLTVTGAARDLAWQIDATRTPGQTVFVLGGSYGTYWAQRYLAIRPDQPTAVILDSTLPASGVDMAQSGQRQDAKARELLAACTANATCLAKLGPDPVAAATQAVAAVDAGTCAPGIGAIRSFLASFLTVGFYFEQMLLPAAIYRILRCEPADLTWLGQVNGYMSHLGASWSAAGSSDATYYNIAFSEMWPSNPSAADLAAQAAASIADDGGAATFASFAPAWPRYALDSYYGTWPSSPATILVLQGTSDPVTPYGDIVRQHYAGANQYYVELPHATHGAVATSLMADPRAPTCGLQVLLSFLADPSRPPDTSCIALMAPLDHGNPPASWLNTVGIADLWENP